MANPDEQGRRGVGPLVRGLPMMLFGLALVFVLMPQLFALDEVLANALQRHGVTTPDHFRGGSPVTVALDPAGDLLRAVDPHGRCPRCAAVLDVRGLTVRALDFQAASGAGFPDQVMLIFDFPAASHAASAAPAATGVVPTIHVFVDRPDRSAPVARSHVLAGAEPIGEDWDLAVEIAADTPLPRLFDAAGALLGEGLGVHVRASTREAGLLAPEQERDEVFSIPEVVRHQIVMQHRAEADLLAHPRQVVALLPMELVGDPREQDWRYWVVVGLPGEGGEPFQVFDVIDPPGEDARR